MFVCVCVLCLFNDTYLRHDFTGYLLVSCQVFFIFYFNNANKVKTFNELVKVANWLKYSLFKPVIASLIPSQGAPAKPTIKTGT